MSVICLHDKSEIEKFLRKNTFLNIYAIGDLDYPYWPHTIWFALSKNSKIKAIALLYFGLSLPSFLAFYDDNHRSMHDLLSKISYLLPKKFYAHLSDGLEKPLKSVYSLEYKNSSYKMGLTDKSFLDKIDVSGVVSLRDKDPNEIINFYQTSYPDSWFEPQMLKTDQYYGIEVNNNLASIAGVHIYSPVYKVAALGNISTHPKYRGQGLAKIATVKLCKSLLNSVDYIGLNVNIDNETAIGLYRNIGFTVISSYNEYMVTMN
jgi:ribosomal protein S18 acetylase RimI-like enzyme